MNHENTSEFQHFYRYKKDTMYNSYEVNFSQIHIKWWKRNWKSPVNGPSLNLKLKMAAKIRRVHLWRFVAVYLWKSITYIYCMCYLSPMGQNSQCWKKKRRIHVNTPLQNKWMEQSVSGMTQDGFVKVIIWQTETGSKINLLCWFHSDSECLDDVSSSSHDFFWRCLSTLDCFPNNSFPWSIDELEKLHADRTTVCFEPC